MSRKINKRLFNALLKDGYIVKDLGDGAWGWTSFAKTELTLYVRALLSECLYEGEILSFERNILLDNGFDEKGFPISDE